MLYSSQIEDELMIQFIILYAICKADEDLAYTDMLSVIQENCEISFMDLQVGLDNLVMTGHVSVRKISEDVLLYGITEKGKNIIEFFYKQIPLIIREPIDASIKALYIEKRRAEAIKADIEPINEREFYSDCILRDDDKTVIMYLRLYAGQRDEAERIAEYFKVHSDKIYGTILNAFKETND